MLNYHNIKLHFDYFSLVGRCIKKRASGGERERCKIERLRNQGVSKEYEKSMEESVWLFGVEDARCVRSSPNCYRYSTTI